MSNSVRHFKLLSHAQQAIYLDAYTQWVLVAQRDNPVENRLADPIRLHLAPTLADKHHVSVITEIGVVF